MNRKEGRAWEKVDYPSDSNFQLVKSGTRLYALFGPKRNAADEGKGVLEIDPESLEMTVLMSSRRHPPVCPFDGRPDLTPFAVFQRGNGTAISVTYTSKDGIESGYIIERKDPGEDWKITSGNLSFPTSVQESEEGTLLSLGKIWSGHAAISQIGFFPHAADPPVYLAASPPKNGVTAYQRNPFDNSDPRWTLPSTIAPDSVDGKSQVVAAYAGGNLYLVSVDKYARGSSRDGKQGEITPGKNHRLHVIQSEGKTVSIPIRFSGADNLKERSRFAPTPSEAKCYEYPSLQKEGIAIVGGNLILGGATYRDSFFGFWRIPLNEIEKEVSRRTSK